MEQLLLGQGLSVLCLGPTQDFFCSKSEIAISVSRVKFLLFFTLLSRSLLLFRSESVERINLASEDWE